MGELMPGFFLLQSLNWRFPWHYPHCLACQRPLGSKTRSQLPVLESYYNK